MPGSPARGCDGMNLFHLNRILTMPAEDDPRVSDESVAVIGISRWTIQLRCIRNAQNCSAPDRGARCRKSSEKAANQTRAIARLRKVRQDYFAVIPRAALPESLALGYIYAAPMGLSVCGFRRRSEATNGQAAENQAVRAEWCNHNLMAEGSRPDSNANPGFNYLTF
jgi:hypothetical protein